MNIFLSWSGKRSEYIADTLSDWLPVVIHHVDTFMSERDIEAGDRWAERLDRIMDDVDFGIVCLTPENQEEPWLLHESGAIGKSVDRSRVIPLLIDMSLSDLELPLSRFQAVELNYDGINKILKSINSVLEDSHQLSTRVLSSSLEAHWSDLSDAIDDIPDVPQEEAILPNEKLINDSIMHGIRRVYPKAGENAEYQDRVKHLLYSENHIQILTVYGGRYIGNEERRDRTKKWIDEKETFQLQVLDPTCEHWDIQYKQFEPTETDYNVSYHNKSNEVKRNYDDIISYTKDIDNPNKRVKYYDRKPVFRIERLGGLYFVAFYGLKARGTYSPVLEFEHNNDSALTQYFIRQFDEYWKR